jgi:hypothetical protein
MKKFSKAISFLYEQFYYYSLYIVKHPLCGIVMLAGILFSYSSYAFATDYYVDSEVIINLPGTNYNWLEIGRYGLVFCRNLLGTTWYNPYYTGILMLLFLWLTGMTFSYVCSKLFPSLSASVITLGSLIFLTYPTFSEQYYFQFQSAEITFGLWLSVLATGMFTLFVKQKRWSCFFCTIPIYVLTFATYQSFIPFALCSYLAIFLSLIFKENISFATLKRSIGGSVIHFSIALLLSQGIGNIFFPSSSYLTDQVIWSTEVSFLDSLLAVAGTCVRMLAGQGVFYTTLLLFSILICAVALWQYRNTPAYQIVLGTLSAIGIVATPFALTLLMGVNTAIRSQFSYSLAAVFLIFFSFEKIFNHTQLFWHRICKMVLLLVTLTQIATVRYIWNAHSYVADYDRETATDLMMIMYDSSIVHEQQGTIFWGYLQPETPYDEKLQNSPSYLFTSVFNLEHDMHPYGYFSTHRVLGYFESLGHTFTYPTFHNHAVSRYIMIHNNPPAFPEDGCSHNDPEGFTINLGNSPEYYFD